MNHQEMKILVVLSVVGAIAVAGLAVVPTMVQSALAVQSSSAAGGAASTNDEEIATTGAASSASTSRNTLASGGFEAACPNSFAVAGACSETGTP
jgi:type II secretory pathway pseudopilin PulG